MKFLIAIFSEMLVSLLLANGAYVLRKAPELGHEVCIMGTKETNVKLRRKITSSREKVLSDCGFLTGPVIECEENIIKTVISYVPQTNTKRVNKTTCCPGWKDYNPSLGCFKPAPCLSLPEYTPSHCVARRREKLVRNRNNYRLRKPPKVPTGDPDDPEGDLQELFVFPLIDLSFNESTRLSKLDGDELPWLLVYGYLQRTAQQFLKEQNKSSQLKPFNNTADFEHLLHVVRGLFTRDGKYQEYFRYPSKVEKWKDIIRCDSWQDDQVFVDERLAALNPMSLQRVTANSEDLWKGVGLSLSELKERLTPKFDWDYAVSSVVRRKTTLDEMVKQNVVYAVHFPYLDEITNVPDITNKHKKRKLKKATSPIALFVSVKTSEGKPYELKPVAIQVDNFHDSPVYTPADGRRWLLAKQLYQIADFAYVEMIEHLLKTHMVLQPVCVTAKRTISVFHPLNELLKWHCRGLISTNVNGFPKLILPGNYMHLLFSMGHRGSIELLNKGFLDLSWEDIDFWKSIKKRGVDDTEKLPYFPYRDDGYLIWEQIQNYVEEYVSLYYNEDKDVSSDSELENFTNELSVDGIGQFGGVGMLRGFPSRIHTKTDLIQTLSRILWLPIQHNAVNYPIAYYGAFVPNMPTKLYDDPRAKTDEYSFYTLPDRGVATIQAVVSTSLGSLRFDNLLDYGAQMLDREAGELVEKHHKILMTKVKATIEKRNDKRFNDGHLTYPYLKPGWIPNSIHT